MLFDQAKQLDRNTTIVLENLVQIIHLSQPKTNTYLVFENMLSSVDNMDYMSLLNYILKNRYSMMFYGVVDYEFLEYIKVKYNEIF
jgi:hypothetical protein